MQKSEWKMSKIQESKGRFTVAIDLTAIKLLKWKKGDEVACIPDTKEDQIILKRIH